MKQTRVCRQTYRAPFNQGRFPPRFRPCISHLGLGGLNNTFSSHPLPLLDPGSPSQCGRGWQLWVRGGGALRRGLPWPSLRVAQSCCCVSSSPRSSSPIGLRMRPPPQLSFVTSLKTLCAGLPLLARAPGELGEGVCRDTAVQAFAPFLGGRGSNAAISSLSILKSINLIN